MISNNAMLLAVLAGSCAIATAQPVTYDFSGTLGDHFVPFIDDGEVTSSQSAGVLRFDTANVVTTTDPVDAYAHTTFSPSYTESWTASIDFVLPLVYDSNFIPNATVDQEIVLGIAAIFTAGDTTWNSVASNFEVYNPGSNFGPVERQYWSDSVVADTLAAENWVDAAGETTGTLTLTFDAFTKVLIASNGYGDEVLAVDVDAPGTNWGMTGTDSFSIGIYGAAKDRAVLSSTPTTMDNFSGEVLATSGPDASYGFDGDFNAEFGPFFDEPGVTSGQAASTLQFHTNDVQIADATDAYVHLAFAPRADQSWTASIDVLLPLIYDSNYTPTVGVDQWIGMGIAAVYDDGVNPFSTAECSLESWNGAAVGDVAGRYAHNDSMFQGNDVFGSVEEAGGIAGGTLTLEYDASTRVITSLAEGFVIGTLNINGFGGNDWGMADSDTFNIGLYAGATNRSIASGNPLTMDNFTATIVSTPEPVCIADLNGDGILDSGDIQIFIAFFLGGQLPADLNGDGILDSGDIQTFIQLFLAGCP
ncbi:MAG: hypothetical protein ACI89L_001210 [Phycisphaerales bacterium]|jgi:hypothetical protein